MSNILFSGFDQSVFNKLTFTDKIKAKWLAFDELISIDSAPVDKDTKLVLFYTSPECYLASLSNDLISNEVDIYEILEQQWLPKTEALMQFYLANKANAILVSSEHLISNITPLNDLLANKFKMKSVIAFDAPNNSALTNQKLENDLSALLLNQMLQLSVTNKLVDNYQVQEGYENLLSAADLLEPDISSDLDERIDKLKLAITATKTEINTTFANYQAKDSENTLALEQALKEIDDLTEEKRKSDGRERAQYEASELSLLQIHQLQEELESTFNHNKQLEAELTKLKEKGAQQKLTHSNAHKEEQQKAHEKISELTTENELSLLHIHQLQEELESTFNHNKQLEAELTKLKEKVAQQELINSNAESEENKKITEKIDELTTENEIALLQIHQLQEELEFYFIKYQAVSGNSFSQRFSEHSLPVNVKDVRFKKSLTLARHLQA